MDPPIGPVNARIGNFLKIDRKTLAPLITSAATAPSSERLRPARRIGIDSVRGAHLREVVNQQVPGTDLITYHLFNPPLV
jgi:hypothetical protein